MNRLGGFLANPRGVPLFGRDALKKRSRDKLNADRQIAQHLISRGNAAREARDWARAALWFEEALRLVPNRADIHVQHGHMLKEAGDFEGAEAAYLAAKALMPDDADLCLQFGHLYKLGGRMSEAREAFSRALVLKPGWTFAKSELSALDAAASTIISAPPADADRRLAEAASTLANPADAARLVPELAPRRPYELLRSHGEGLYLRQMGRHEYGFWGLRRTLHGTETVRGLFFSRVGVAEVQMYLDGVLFHRDSALGPYPIAYECDENGPEKYVFNIWYDFSQFSPGLHAFELRVIDLAGEIHSFHDRVVIGPRSAAESANSDAFVNIVDADPVSLDRRIRMEPSVVRSAVRELLPRPPRTILVLRTDQLGDMVASVPAMRRLRVLFPDARIVGLLTSANAELAATLDLFNEVIVVDFPDDPYERRRLMPLDAQDALRRKLEPYQFDLAIDLAQAGVSRDLLRLSGAPFLYGVQGSDYHWLSADFALNTRDPLDRLDVVPHSRKVLALVETLGAIVRDSFETVVRTDLPRDRLERFGLERREKYVVLHMGARIPFSRWPGFARLAAMLLERTDLKVVMMTEDGNVRTSLNKELLASDRFLLLDQRLAFDDFDAFVSYATVLVGNDSGPKHLASLRGTPAITLHMARINWSTWGQEGSGMIISRRVPCAGCDIFHEGEDCGKDFACIRDIRPEEVFGAVMTYV